MRYRESPLAAEAASVPVPAAQGEAPEGQQVGDPVGVDIDGDSDDFDYEEMERFRQQQRAAASRKKRMKQMRSESKDAQLALCRVQKNINRGERLDCANRIRAAVAT